MNIKTKEQLFRLIRDEVSNAGGSLNGPSLGNLLHHKYGDPLPQLGFSKLSEAVREAEELGYVKMGKSMQHLNILQCDQRERSPNPAEQATDMERLYVKKEFWEAMFLNSDEAVSYRYDKSRNVLVKADAVSAPRQDEVILEPVGLEVQERWLQEFLMREKIKMPESVQSLLPNADALGRRMAREWRQERTIRAIGLLKEWAEKHGIDPSEMFQDVVPRAGSESVSTARRRQDEAQLRNSVITAVSQMNAAQLEKISKAVVVCLYGGHETP